jgi:hypothetical protein
MVFSLPKGATRAVPMLTYFFSRFPWRRARLLFVLFLRSYTNVNVVLRAVRRDNLWAFGTKRKRTVHLL